MDSSEQDQIASLVENQNCPANELQACVAGLIRDAFYQHGYMEAVVQLPRMSFSRVDQSEIENRRKYYVARGYSRFAVVPQTIVNEEKREITLSLEVQPEG